MKVSDDSIRLLGADLELGSAHAGLLCPACHGGQSREGSMRIWRTPTGIRYKCYRNKCGAYGLVADSPSAGFTAKVKQRQQKQSKPREYYGTPVPLPAEHVQWYETRFGLMPSDLRFAQVAYDAQKQRHVWPVHDPFMRVRGHMLRAASPTWTDAPISVQEPKSLLFWNTEQPRSAWYRTGLTDKSRVLLVEDQISALKASGMIDSVALLGTSLNEDVAAEIARQGYDEILLALDQDATGTAYRLVRRYASLLPIRPVTLLQDVKDMSYDDIRRLVE